MKKMSQNILLNITIVFCIGLSGLLFPRNILIINESKNSYGDFLPNSAGQYHLPINIEGDENIAPITSDGDGSAINPYIIENLDIDVTTNEAYGLILTDISKYIIIRNVQIYSSDEQYHIWGFYFNNCSNIQVMSCSSTNTECSAAMRVYNCNNIRITGCFFSHIDMSIYFNGIYLENCNNSVISNNSFSEINLGRANSIYIDVRNSNNASVTNNQITAEKTEQFTGIRLISCDSAIVENNIIQSQGSHELVYAFEIQSSPKSKIRNNVIKNIISDQFYGYAIQNCNNSLIEKNKITDITSILEGRAFAFYYLQHCVITKNQITNFSYSEYPSYGMDFFSTMKNRIYNNIIAGGEIPIHDDSGTNYWMGFDYWIPSGANRAIGNYYWNYSGTDNNGDYIGDLPYNDTKCYDPFPLLSGGLDTDEDGLYNAQEISYYHTDPNKADTDGDGWTDYQELNEYGTNPLKKDSDNDGFIDSIDTLPLTSNLPQENTTIIVMNNNAVNSTATSNQSNNQSNSQSSGDNALNQTNTANEIPWGSISQDIRTIGIIAVGIVGTLVVIIMFSFQKLAKQGNLNKLITKKEEK